jgi:prepilin-type N-terminal cleavage/methylation domain-containing protein
MRSQQSGFTLVEIAIVLVIIGLLLGGILKGQELINSAKVKNIANDFRVIPTYIYAYQDRFKALPGDDVNVVAHIGTTCDNGTNCKPGNGNGVIDGAWNTAASNTVEAAQFWEHVRLGNLAAGPTTLSDATYIPQNAVGGRIGVSSMTSTQIQITGMTGTYQICSTGILGRFAKQLDIQMDDGNTAAGSMRAIPDIGNATTVTAAAGTATGSVDDATSYTVCMSF